MKGRWTRNKDDVLAWVCHGQVTAAIYPVGLGTYSRPWKLTLYSDGARTVAGCYPSINAAKAALQNKS